MSTLKQILKSPAKGGLTSNVGDYHFLHNDNINLITIQNLVYRYDTKKTADGVGGEEGTFCLCTLWCVTSSWLVAGPCGKLLGTLLLNRCIEALTRACQSDRTLIPKAVSMFEVRHRTINWDVAHIFVKGLFALPEPRRTLHGRNFWCWSRVRLS